MNEFTWWYGQDEEHYSSDAASKEDAIARGKIEYGGDGFWIIEAMHAVPSVPDADKFLETYYEINEELGGEDLNFGEDMSVTAEQEAELTALLAQNFEYWMKKNDIEPPYVSMFGATRNKEFIPAAEQDPDIAREDRDERNRIITE